jgi:hypothetical protein
VNASPGQTWATGRVQVWFPWKGMLIASLALTVALNLLLWLS